MLRSDPISATCRLRTGAILYACDKPRMTSIGHGEDDRSYHWRRYFQIPPRCFPSRRTKGAAVRQ